MTLIAKIGISPTGALEVALFEEATKASFFLVLGLLAALGARGIESPLHGTVHGGAVGLGYALSTLALTLLAAPDHADLTLASSTLLAGLGHASFTALTGLGIGIASATRGALLKLAAPIFGFGLAIALNISHVLLIELPHLLRAALLLAFAGVFFVLLFAFALRDRAIVANNLTDEANAFLHRGELRAMTSLANLLPLWNLLRLRLSPGGYRAASRKQLLLAKLAFMKHRRRTDPSMFDLREESLLRERIVDLSRRGVFVGSRPT